MTLTVENIAAPIYAFSTVYTYTERSYFEKTYTLTDTALISGYILSFRAYRIQLLHGYTPNPVSINGLSQVRAGYDLYACVEQKIYS